MGKGTKYEFYDGDVVWDRGNKCYGVVLSNYDNPINRDGGEIRLDSDGNQSIFEYDENSKTGQYNLVPYGSKEDEGDGDLTSLKAGAKRLIEMNKDYSNERYESYKLIYCKLLSGEFDKKKSCGGTMGNGGSADGDRHKYYVKAWKSGAMNYKKLKPDYENKESMNWDEAKALQEKLEDKYNAVGIYAKKDNREVSISLATLSKGGSVKGKSFASFYSRCGGVIFGGYFPEKKSLGGTLALAGLGVGAGYFITKSMKGSKNATEHKSEYTLIVEKPDGTTDDPIFGSLKSAENAKRDYESLGYKCTIEKV